MLLGLLFATAAAFAITEHLKLLKSPVTGTQVSRYVSPGCGCPSGKATVSVKLRHNDVVTVRILDAQNQPVATLATRAPERRGRISFVWRGQTDAGGRARDGSYWAEIALPHRTIILPNRIHLDTRPPRVRLAVARPRVFSPDGDGQADVLRIRYRLSEHAHFILYHGSRVLLRTHSAQPDDKTSWNGKVGGKAWLAGTYTLSVGAVDLAGNVTPPAQRQLLVLTIRYVTLARSRIPVKAGARFAVRVHADAPYTWDFAHRHGKSSRAQLHLRAPAKKGRYRLLVRESGHVAKAQVVVK